MNCGAFLDSVDEVQTGARGTQILHREFSVVASLITTTPNVQNQIEESSNYRGTNSVGSLLRTPGSAMAKIATRTAIAANQSPKRTQIVGTSVVN